MNNRMTGGVAVARNSSAMVPEEVYVNVTPTVGEAGSFRSDMVSLTVIVEAPLAQWVDHVVRDPVGVPPLAATRGGSLRWRPQPILWSWQVFPVFVAHRVIF